MKGSEIMDLQPVKRADGGVTYIPTRREHGALTEIDARPLAAATQYQPITEELAGSYKNRAIGFSIKTWQLSAVVGFVAWLVGGKLLMDHPLLSLGALAWLITGFGLVWAGAFVLDLFLSPSGVAWYSARRMWNHLDREQAERWRYWGGNQDD